MLSDILLKILGENPAAYQSAKHKTAIIIVDLAFILVPLILILLFLSPFIYLWLKKKRFTLRNILISFFVGAGLVALGMLGVYGSILLLHGLAVQDIYGGSPYF